MATNQTNFEQSIKPTIKENYIRNILQAYEAKGLSGDKLLADLDIKPLSEQGCSRISVNQFMALTEAIQEILDDEMLGYMAKPVPLGSLDLISKTMVKLPTLGDALEFYNNYLALFNEGRPLFELLSVKGEIKLVLRFNTPLQKNSPYFIQRMLLTSYKCLCWLSKTKIALNDVSFSFPIEYDVSEFAYVFGCKAIIEGEDSYISFRKDILDLPITQTRHEVEEFSKNFGFYTLLWPSKESLEIKIRHIIGPDISPGFPSFDAIASALNVSSQTLSRRLHESGLTYQSIKDDVRRDAAIALLNAGNKTIKEVAFAVGFKESSSFSKAFKQWVGVSPSEY